MKDGKRMGLFHKNSKGNTVIYFSENVKDNVLQGFSLRVSKKVGNEQSSAVNHSFTVGEAQTLMSFVNKAIDMSF
jgi:hypothetical protein